MELLNLPDGRRMSRSDVAKLIDHAVLRPDATDEDLTEACELAIRLQVASVCVKPCDVASARALVGCTGVRVCSVVAFPHGNSSSAKKVAEAIEARRNGADELDFVLNIGALRSGRLDDVRAEIRGVVEACPGATLKVIFESALLSRDQIIAACRVSEEAGAHFVKTSTGFAVSGATFEDVQLMRQSVASSVGVKASGGIRTLDDLAKMVVAGATRIGTTSTEAILSAFDSL